MMGVSNAKIALLLALVLLACPTESFSTTSLAKRQCARQSSLLILRESTDTDDASEPEKLSLEEKMKSWEASEDEIRAASLGGVVPQSRERTGAFDVGLYIAFPIMVLTGLAFAFFPLIMGNIDVSDIVVPTE